jgi:hypothetical protein
MVFGAPKVLRNPHMVVIAARPCRHLTRRDLVRTVLMLRP